ncbi:IS66 family insertion sequence element accessory protein TnpB [Marinobacterium aestuariivivens]|uniref:IS66 family insertion sequence element accessory protein TnpB n=1 Tax=Marinobacterium aestuariivivens TaxID=1698799 RepID=A0ABW2A331_9GAMM
MFTPGSQARIWLCTEPTDMRKSFDGLSALVKNRLDREPLSGQYFVFVNRRKTVSVDWLHVVSEYVRCEVPI